MKFKSYLTIILFIIFSCNIAYGIDNQQVISQMNYCINSLTRIINASSTEEIDHEINQILNNLTMEQIEGMDDINLFRMSLYNNAAEAQITQEERMLRKKLQQMKRDQAKWSAISGALDNAMMLIPGNGAKIGPQLAFYGIVTMVRSGVDYMNVTKSNDILEQAELWSLKKRDMQTWKSLRSAAQEIVYNIYNKYHLKEYDRLTEETSNLYYQIIKGSSPERRIRQLYDNSKIFSNQIDYYYYLGVSYYELKNYQKAEEYFKKYEEVYNNIKLFRHDEKSGLIALYRLEYLQNLTLDEQITLVNNVITNLPNNGLAYLTCALTLLGDGQKETAATILRRALDNPNISNINEVMLGALKLLPQLNPKSPNYKSLLTSIGNYRSNYFIAGAVTDIYNDKRINWDFWNSSYVFNNFSYRPWYTGWLGTRQFDNNFEISTKGNLFSEQETKIYILHKTNGQKTLEELVWKYKYGVTQSKILEKVKILSEHPELITIFFDIVIPDSIYYVKKNINYESLKQCDVNDPYIQQIKEKLPQINLSYDEQSADGGLKKVVKKNRKQIEELAKFLKKNQNKAPNRDILVCSKSNSEERDIYYNLHSSIISPKKISIKYSSVKKDSKDTISFKGVNFMYSPIYNQLEDGTYALICRKSILDFVSIFKFDSGKNSMNIFAITLYNITYFKNSQRFLIPKNNIKNQKNKNTTNQKENKITEDNDPWYSKLWNWIPNTLVTKVAKKDVDTKESNSSDSKNDSTVNKEEKWYDSSVKWAKEKWSNWFGDDEEK